ncbi:SDR family oxidoreductase [Rhodopirellula sp. JC740]|uniref:SDR family oxidoreductase n=1 Tax=Rhodopirellula halodulae TaxID=2894198 RepID=A0ABS8NN99_9BACT|nr:SDR family oxidoreductase [Rhodopirellula sp. JC740]MCC9645046.1 SDR family oxidoreductase [Rhodopirellula sp. JC740]
MLTLLDQAFDRLSESKCLVTGAAGFIGSQMVEQLLKTGAEVVALDNLSTGFLKNLTPFLEGPDHERLHFIGGDAADRECVEKAVEGVDHIFHFAAMASVPRSMREPGLCHEWTTTSTVELLTAGAAAGVKRFVLSSTSAIYGNSPYVSKREDDTPAPLSPYAAAKLSSENYCQVFHREFSIEPVVLRYFNVFGPRQDPKSEYSAVIPRFVSMILKGERPVIYGDGQQSRDFVYVRDVANANMLAATVPDISGGVFNVGRGERTTLLELLDTLRDLLHGDIQPIHDPPRAGDVRDSLADINQIRSRMGFEPTVGMTEGLRESIEYYRGICSTNNKPTESKTHE